MVLKLVVTTTNVLLSDSIVTVLSAWSSSVLVECCIVFDARQAARVRQQAGRWSVASHHFLHRVCHRSEDKEMRRSALQGYRPCGRRWQAHVDACAGSAPYSFDRCCLASEL